jgi:hypothetical protein
VSLYCGKRILIKDTCPLCCIDCELSEDEMAECPNRCSLYISNPICKDQQILSREEFSEKVRSVNCDFCGERMGLNNRNRFREYTICDDCWDEYIEECQRCHTLYDTDVARWVEESGGYYCESCLNEYTTYCDLCGRYVDLDDVVRDSDGDNYCPDCARDRGLL